MSPAPRSFSLTRGQADAGLGEGPGRPSLGGEQYLTAEGGLERDGPFLDAARPWMTLDAAPRDLARLGDRLEAWSALRLGNRWLVVRLVPAGTYDHRAAYRAHGRVWPTGATAPDFDPAVLVGDAAAFPANPGAAVPRPVEALVPRIAGLDGEQEAITRLLAFLYTAVQANRQLLVTAPLEEFTTGSPLARRLALARAALPAGLKNELRLRIYAADPLSFLHQDVTLLALPAELAGEALGRAPGAVLVSSQGERLEGFAASDEARRYADFAIARAFAEPAVLLGFAERVSRRAPLAADALEPAWELASALPHQDAQRLTAVLAALASGPATGRALSAEDWAAIPDDALRATLLAPGEGVITEAHTEARRRGLALDGEIAHWWRQEAWRAGRLVVLAAGLVDPNRAADRTLEIANVELGEATAAVLALERLTERIERRLGNAAAVRMLDESAAVTRELVAAAEAGQVREPSALLAIAERAEAVGLAVPWPEHLLDAELAKTLRADSVPASEVVRELDRRLERNASVVLPIFAHGDGWAWRRATRASAAVRRAAALAWLAKPSGREERLEVWNALVDDLAPGLSGDEMGRLWRGSVGASLIPPFELDQLRRLGQRAADLTAQAILVERVPPRAAQQLAAELAALEDLPPGAFLHLVEPRRQTLLPAPPPLQREQAAPFRRLAPGREAAVEHALAALPGTAPDRLVDRLFAALASGSPDPASWQAFVKGSDRTKRWDFLFKCLTQRWPGLTSAERRRLEKHAWSTLTAAETSTAPRGDWLQFDPRLLECLAWIEPEAPIADLAFRFVHRQEAVDWPVVVALTALPAVPPDDRRRWPEAELAYLWHNRLELADPEPLERAFNEWIWKGSFDMNDVVTWFCSHREAPERSGAFPTTWGGEPVEAVVWPPLAAKPPSSLDAVTTELERAGGGVVIARKEPGGRLEVRTVPGSRYPPASRWLAIDPGGNLTWLALESGSLQPSRGQRFLVPVDAKAEALLGQLVTSLEGLPKTQRALVVQSLAAPSLQLRLERLEGAAEPTTTRSQISRWFGPKAARVLPVAAALGILAVGITIGAWLGKPPEPASDPLAAEQAKLLTQDQLAKELERRTKEILDRLDTLKPGPPVPLPAPASKPTGSRAGKNPNKQDGAKKDEAKKEETKPGEATKSPASGPSL